MPSDPAPLSVIVRLPGRPARVLTLEAITARVRARTEGLKMGRLADRFKQTQGSIDSLHEATEKDLDAIDARVIEVHKTREDVMTRKRVALDSQMGDLKDFAKDLEDFGKNDHSGDGTKSGNAYVGTNGKK